MRAANVLDTMTILCTKPLKLEALCRLLGCLAIALSAACGPAEDSAESEGSPAAERRDGSFAPVRFVAVEGFNIPESMRHDPEQDIYFVSNVNESGHQKLNNGFISRLRPDGSIEELKFIEGGADGVTLHAPKGMSIVGSTLWVADIDAVRGFDRRTGAAISTIDLSPNEALFLNDMTVGPDGALYVTDSGFRFDASGEFAGSGPYRIFRVSMDGEVTLALEADTLAEPNGIFWDAAAGHFIIASLDAPTVFSWRPGDSAPSLLATGGGSFDGVEGLADGRTMVSSLSDSAVYILGPEGAITRLIEGVPTPADIGLDAGRNRVLIPTLGQNRVEIWELR